ncbi:MAG: outer membrane beta-barrel family protein, partial [Paramuribaculum sp.]|nr:outer membrane beta-barrel family protein [Paramuribaculum sp.]
LKPFFRYADYDNRGEDVSAELNAAFNDVTIEFIQNIYSGNSTAALGNLINRRIESDRLKGHSLNVGGDLRQTVNIPRTDDLLTIELYGSYDNRHDKRFNHFDINFGADPEPTDVANRYYKNYPQFHSNLGAQAQYSLIINRGLSFDFGYAFEYLYGHETSSLFNIAEEAAGSGFIDGKLPSAIEYQTGFDRDNSYVSRETTDRHKLFASVRIWQNYNKTDRFWMQYRFPLNIDRQRMHYTRGDINETLTRTSAVMDFGNMFIQTGNDKKGFWLNWDLKSLKPDMVSMVDFTDATNPLFIRKGNPDLKNALKFSADMSYKFSFGNQLRNQLRLCADFNLTDNALSYGYTYDSTTGIRIGRYHNVKGNLGGNGEIIYTFDANGFRIYNKLQGGRRTSVDLVGYDSPTLTRSKVYDLNFSDEMYFSYSFGSNRVSANFSGINNRFSSYLADFINQNTWTFRTGVSLLYNLPANFQISTDFTVFNRRGYTDEALNTDNFIWNARLTYTMLKGQLLIMLDGYDMLHDLSNVSYTSNAQTRTETIRTVL